MRLLAAAEGMPAGSAGIVIGWWVDGESCLVRFWDGGPIRVPGALLAEVAEASEAEEPAEG